MTNRQIDNRAKAIRELERQKKELESRINALKDEIKTDMESRELDDIETGNFHIRFQVIVSNSFDTKAFKTERPRLYKKFLKESQSKRFTIA